MHQLPLNDWIKYFRFIQIWFTWAVRLRSS